MATADYFIEGERMEVRGFVRMEYLLSPVPGATKPSAPVVTVAKVAGSTGTQLWQCHGATHVDGGLR